LVWGAYLAIPAVLLYYARRRPSVPFRHLFWLFGTFILACGMTHFMGWFVTINPVYRLDGLIKLLTGIVSWATVAALFFVAPRALALRMPEELEAEIEERKQAETELATMNRRLEERTDQLKGALEELEGFCYNISHDLRTPLRGIVGHSRIVIEDSADRLDERSRGHLERLGVAANKMGKLIDDLLEFARLGRGDLADQSVDFSSLATDVATVCCAESGANISVQPGIATQGDAQLLRIVLQNLIENACKYVVPGEKAQVKVGMKEIEGVSVFFVKDMGIGFEMQYAERILQPFQRLHRDEEYPGTGIGLANVKRIVERHGGELWCESIPDEGATFYFTLGEPRPGPKPQSQLAKPTDASEHASE
jgi:light-regulated signal transduction histidine kinase (bacteriophytochrome)